MGWMNFRANVTLGLSSNSTSGKLSLMTKAAALTILTFTTAAAQADSTADFLSGNGYHLFLAYGAIHTFQTSKEDGVRLIDSMIATTIATEGLKAITREERPDHSDHKSFPSGHASAAFTVAAFQATTHPKEAPYWYLGAALIGQSRVTLHRHFEHDVLAGAVIGYLSSTTELKWGGWILKPAPDGAKFLGISVRF